MKETALRGDKCLPLRHLARWGVVSCLLYSPPPAGRDGNASRFSLCQTRFAPGGCRGPVGDPCPATQLCKVQKRAGSAQRSAGGAPARPRPLPPAPAPRAPLSRAERLGGVPPPPARLHWKPGLRAGAGRGCCESWPGRRGRGQVAGGDGWGVRSGPPSPGRGREVAVSAATSKRAKRSLWLWLGGRRELVGPTVCIGFPLY